MRSTGDLPKFAQIKGLPVSNHYKMVIIKLHLRAFFSKNEIREDDLETDV